MEDANKFHLKNLKSFPDSSLKNGDEFSLRQPAEGQGDDLSEKVNLNVKNKIARYAERNLFRLNSISNQDERGISPTQKSTTNSNRTKIQSNQKGAHYVTN